jgi:hypothetical protein
VRSIERTAYTAGWRAGETDYGITFDVCATAGDGGELLPAVEGELAHVSTLSAELMEFLEGADLDCQESTQTEAETAETCAFRFNGDGEPLVIASGDPIGTAGGTGATEYEPGLDFNLLDTRFPVAYANPDRLGGEEYPGRWFRYGACVYEYFTDPTRAGYLDKVGQNGVIRDDAEAPCGRLAIDQPGKATGIWMHADEAERDYETDWVGVLSNLLVVGPHPIYPATHEVISTELLDLASVDGHGILLEYEAQGSGDVNPRFQDLELGTTY